jgi:hypothetical protein
LSESCLPLLAFSQFCSKPQPLFSLPLANAARI